jgi:hypothetical protein
MRRSNPLDLYMLPDLIVEIFLCRMKELLSENFTNEQDYRSLI